jgi:two-component system, OmpR family, sensor histidine kinase KdpD
VSGTVLSGSPQPPDHRSLEIEGTFMRGRAPRAGRNRPRTSDLVVVWGAVPSEFPSPSAGSVPWAGSASVREMNFRLRAPTRSGVYGALTSVAALAVVTAAIELLKGHVPVLSLAVLYIFAVLPLAIVWGLGFGIVVAVASMLAFNFFFLPPLYTFTLQDSRNWFALLVFVVTAVVVSELAARSRREARESALLARIATSLLEHGSVSAELERIGAEAAKALQVERAQIELGPRAVRVSGESHPLTVAERTVGTIYLESSGRGSARVRRRLLPALASLLGVAIDRERLALEAVDAEALRRSDAMKTAVLRAVSHDLRTPLMAILTSAGALRRDDLALDAADRGELVDTIFGEAERLDRLVNNLLDLSRLQAGAAEPEPAVWAIDDVVLQALDSVDGVGDRVEVSLPEDESAAVRVDVHQIERVIANLIENALRYSPADEPVRVQVSETGSEVLVRIVDRGSGIAMAEAERIFEPFARGARSSDVRGAGLGLAIARGFAEANGGRVWAESRAEQGAAFVLALPKASAVSAVPS